MADPWAGREPEIGSPYYPYRKVVATNSLAGCEQIPYLLSRYIADLPLNGYTPPSDNSFPRARLKKMLYWDGPMPLDQPLPTTEQMQSIRFDPGRPGSPPDPTRGFRIFPQELTAQAQATSKSIIRVYLGGLTRVQIHNTFVWRQGIVWTIMVHYDLEGNMGTTDASRSFAMTQAIVEATDGLDIGGVGGICTRQITKFDDERTNTGYKIYQDIDWCTDAPSPAYSEND